MRVAVGGGFCRRNSATLAGASGNLSAQYEHTMIITQGAPIVVTQHHEFIGH
jgi:hypothetical protein